MYLAGAIAHPEPWFEQARGLSQLPKQLGTTPAACVRPKLAQFLKSIGPSCHCDDLRSDSTSTADIFRCVPYETDASLIAQALTYLILGVIENFSAGFSAIPEGAKSEELTDMGSGHFVPSHRF